MSASRTNGPAGQASFVALYLTTSDLEVGALGPDILRDEWTRNLTNKSGLFRRLLRRDTERVVL